VAAAIKQAINIQPSLEVGRRGEFTVWVDGTQVAQKELTDDQIVASVQAAVR
jgi:hypothetical protein